MKLIAYLRVSDPNDKNAQSFEIQEDTIRAFCGRSGHIVVDVFKENRSGSSLQAREAFKMALEGLDLADGIIVARQDRLTRDSADFHIIKKELERLGKKLVFADSGMDLETDEGGLLAGIQANVHEYDRKKIVKRCQAGKDKKRETDPEWHEGRPPYGWRSIRGHLEPVEAEQLVITRSRQLKRKRWSCQQIADALESEGLASISRHKVRRILSRG